MLEFGIYKIKEVSMNNNLNTMNVIVAIINTIAVNAIGAIAAAAIISSERSLKRNIVITS